MMPLLNQVKIFPLMMLFFPRSDCCKGKGTGTTSTGMYHPGISDPGEMEIVQHHSLLWTLTFQPCSSLEVRVHISQQRFIILTETLPVSSLISLTATLNTPRMALWCVEAAGHADPAGDGMLTRGPGTW